MANYYQNADGTTSTKLKGRNFVQQNDGTTIESGINNVNVKNKKKQKKDSFSTTINKLGDVFDNSSVKNRGLSFSNAVTDLANLYDASKNVAKSIPVAGKLFQVGDTAVNTMVNTATNLGTGAMKSVEGTADFVSDLVVNPLERGINYAIDYAKNGKKVADENLKDLKKMQQRDIKKDLTKEFQDKVGYSDVVDDLEKNSLVRRDNLGGQVAQAVGGMVPALVMGQAFAKTPVALQSTKGLKGLEKAKVITGNIGKNFVKQLPSNALLGTSSYGSGVEEALNNGATLEQARLYGIGSSAKEMATEWITGGIPGLGGKGGLDLPAEKLINKTTGKIKNEYAKAFAKTLANYGYKFVGEGLEEGLSEIIDPYLKNATYSNGEKVNLPDVFLNFLIGGLTGGFLEAPNTIVDFKNNIVEAKSNIQKKKALLPVANSNDINNNQQQNNIEGNPLVENNSQVGLPLDSNTIQKMSGVNQNQERFVYESSDNSKIDNFRKSANQFMNNSLETKDFVQTVEKVINDKDYNITFDSALGDNVNGRIGINDNGEVDIRINPNSDRAGEFILTHEITHAIETDEMKNLVIDYASKNAEFNDALESLKQTYGVDDVNDEVLADISGQLLGTEEFINKLSTTKPNLFKRIYDKIISFANKITGNSRESFFIKNLKNKWEKAYRNTTNEQAINNLKNNTKFSKGKLISGEDVIVSDDINGSHPSKKIAEQNLKAMLGIKYLNSSNNTEISIENKDIKKYLNDGYNNQKNMKLKKRLSGNYGEVLEIAQIDPNKSRSNYKGTNRGKQGFDYYDVNIAYPVKDNNGNIINYKYYESRLVVRKDNNNNFAYDLDGFKEKKGAVLDKTSLSIMADKSADGSFSEDNISQSNNTVNNNVLSNTKYSMQNNKKNTQELEDSSFSLEQRVSGDELLDAQDLIEEVKSVGAKVDKNGYVTLYHQTTTENANKIKQSGKMIAKEPYVYFSTSKSASQSDGRGTTKLEFKIPAEKLILDDIFADNADVKVRLNSNKELDVSNYMVKNTQELDNSSFSFDEKAKKYNDLNETKKIEFYTKDNGDIHITLLDSNSTLVNEFTVFSEKDLKKQLGDSIGEYINSKSTSNINSINLESNKSDATSGEDYRMAHRPSEDYGNASDFERNMSDIFDHPNWYLDMTEPYNIESLNALRKVRNNPEGKLKIYRATPGDEINPGDWVTPSKKYAKEHLKRSLDGKGKILEMTVKAKDVLFAGDDINEFGYFPENEKYSKKNGSWQEFVERNFKSIGTKHQFENIKYNATDDSLEKNNDVQVKNNNTKKKNKKNDTYFKRMSKIIQYEDYSHQENFKKIVSEYNKNTSIETIKKDIESNFSQSKKDYTQNIIDHIKYEILRNEIYVPEEVRKKFSSFSNFLKNNYDTLKLRKYGDDIIDIYNELSRKYPTVFSEKKTVGLNGEELNDMRAQMLNRISVFTHEDFETQSKYNLETKAMELVSNYIYDAIHKNQDIDDLISSFDMSPKQIRKEKTYQLREKARELISNSYTWVDKKSGLSYKINTMKRNFYDVMGKDANKIYASYIQPIFKHNAQMQKDISNYNERINKLCLTDKESQAVQMFGEYKYNPETLVTGSQVDDFLEQNNLDYKKVEDAVEVFRRIYDELFERVNPVLKEYGYPEIEYRKGYFPHFVDEKPKDMVGKTLEKLGWKFKNDNLPITIAGMTETFKPGKVWTSFQQNRKGKITSYNALKGMDNYLRGAMETIYFTEDIQNLRALENEIRYQHSDKSIQSKIDEIYADSSLTFGERQDKIEKVYKTYTTSLNNLVTELRDYTNGIANKKSNLDRTVEALSNRKYYNVMENVTNRLSANMVGMNFSSAMTNFIPITQAASQVKSKYLIKGLREAIKSQYSGDGFESNSVFLTSRLNAAEPLYKTKLDKISQKMNFMFDGIDSITSNTIVRGKYYENIAKGMTKFDAMQNADEFARDLMAGRTKGEMPTAFNSKNPLIKTLTAFQLEVNNQFGYMFKDLPRDLSDEGKNKLVSAFVKMFFGAWIYNQLTEKIVGRKSAFSPVDTIKEVYDTATNPKIKTSDKAANILENLTQDVPFVGGLIGGGRLPISSAANPVKILRGESTVKDEAKKAFYYTVLPFGGGQLKKTIEGASMYVNDKKIKGSYTSKGQLRFEAAKDPVSIAQSLVFGQYASKNGRQYFDNSYSPLTDKQLKEVEKMEISVSKYRKYQDDKKEINKIKSDKDEDGKSINGSAAGKKAYLIMNSNFSKKEKNYLLSKIGNSKVSVKVDDLEQLPNDKKIYKFYFGLNKDSKKDFVNEIKNYNVDPEDLYNYYSKRQSLRREYTSGFAKKEMVEYIKNSKFDEKTKWYLYNKDYGSDISELLVNTFGIKTDDYFNTMEYADKIAKDYPNTKQASIRKRKVFEYINNLKCSQKQKIVLFSRAGYSTSEFKNSMYTYINGLKLTQSEKEKIWNSLY